MRNFEKLYKGCEKSFLVAVDKAIALQKENQELRSRIAELEAAVESENETFRRIMDEKCPTDERHCTCVPLLRSRIVEMEVVGLRDAKLAISNYERAKVAETRFAELKAAQRWIPVGKRLPDDGIAVLVWDVDIPRRGWLEDGLWQDENQDYLSGVTHWMDLPDAPGWEK